MNSIQSSASCTINDRLSLLFLSFLPLFTHDSWLHLSAKYSREKEEQRDSEQDVWVRRSEDISQEMRGGRERERRRKVCSLRHHLQMRREGEKNLQKRRTWKILLRGKLKSVSEGDIKLEKKQDSLWWLWWLVSQEETRDRKKWLEWKRKEATLHGNHQATVSSDSSDLSVNYKNTLHRCMCVMSLIDGELLLCVCVCVCLPVCVWLKRCVHL